MARRLLRAAPRAWSPAVAPAVRHAPMTPIVTGNTRWAVGFQSLPSSRFPTPGQRDHQCSLPRPRQDGKPTADQHAVQQEVPR